MNRVIAFDLDGTLLRSNCSFHFARYLLSKRVLTSYQFGYLVYQFLLFRLFSTSYTSLQTALFNHLFQGAYLKLYTDHVPSFVQEKIPALYYKRAIVRLQEHLKQGDKVMILSNSPEFLVEPIGKSLGVIESYGSRYAIDKDGRLTDIAFLLDGKNKANFVKEQAALINSSEIYTYSDSCHDLPLLEIADHPVVVRPSNKLKKIAKKRGWKIL